MKRWPFFLILIVMLLLILAGLRPAQPVATVVATEIPRMQATALPAASTVPVALQLDPLGRSAASGIVAAQLAQARATSFRVTSTVAREGKTYVSVIEYQAPSSFRLVAEGGASIIVVGSQAWQQVDGDPWRRTGSDVVHDMQAMRPQLGDTDRILASLRDATFEGIQSDGTWLYRYATELAIRSGRVTQNVQLWVDSEHGWPVRIRSEVGNTITILFMSAYNAEFTIKQPIP